MPCKLPDRSALSKRPTAFSISSRSRSLSPPPDEPPLPPHPAINKARARRAVHRTQRFMVNIVPFISSDGNDHVSAPPRVGSSPPFRTAPMAAHPSRAGGRLSPRGRGGIGGAGGDGLTADGGHLQLQGLGDGKAASGHFPPGKSHLFLPGAQGCLHLNQDGFDGFAGWLGLRGRSSLRPVCKLTQKKPDNLGPRTQRQGMESAAANGASILRAGSFGTGSRKV